VDLIDVEWDSLPVLSSVEQALASGAPLSHPERGTNVGEPIAG
jgi:CO/xanthine dehydrogenase Mo-binding subunit